MERTTRGLDAAVAAGTVALHALGLYALVRMDAAWRVAPREPAPRHSLEVEFFEVVPRKRATLEHADVAPAVPMRTRARNVSPPPVAANVPSGVDNPNSPEVSEQTPQRLDLSVPRPRPDAERGPQRGWLERPPALEPQRTRFSAHWVTDGTAIEQARFRSKAVDIAVGLFGAPPRKCNEVERRLRRPDCLPPDADELELEALRRSLDQ